MKLKFYTIVLVAVTVLLISCKSATKLYEKGRYDEAVEIAAKKLQKDPDDQKLLDVLQSAYRYAVEDHESQIRNHSSSSNELKWESVYSEYSSLQRLYESIRNSPGVFRIVNPTDYGSYLVTYSEKAGEVRYERGLYLMSSNNKLDFRKAYREFQAALRFIPGDIEIRQKLDEAYSNAVVNVVVSQLDQRNSYQYSSYSNRYQSFDDNILRYLQQNNSNEFVRYYSSYEAGNRNIRPDHMVDVRFTSINVGRSQDDRSTRTVFKDVVVKETVYRPDSIIKEYAKVQAKITTTKRTIRSEGLIMVSVRDQNNRTVWNDSFSGQHFWTTEFAGYTGDARAMTEADKQLVNSIAQQPPRDEEIIRCIMDEIQSKAECGIKDYFNRF